MAYEKKTGSYTTKNGVTFQYYVYENRVAGKAPALLVYLSGTDGVGDDLTKLLRIESLPSYLEQGKITLPEGSVLLAPQCPAGHKWYAMPGDVTELIESMARQLGADEKRVSLTGCSLGGMGTYAAAIARPEMFSCIVPVCGSVKAEDCAVLTKCPVWIFHGELDDGMGFSSVEANCVIKQAGGTCRLTLLPDEGHEIRHVYYDECYRLIEWMTTRVKA